MKMIFSHSSGNPSILGNIADGRPVILLDCLDGPIEASPGASTVHIRPQLVWFGTSDVDLCSKNISGIALMVPGISELFDLPDARTRLKCSILSHEDPFAISYNTRTQLFQSRSQNVVVLSYLLGGIGNKISLVSYDEIEISLSSSVKYSEALEIARCFVDLASTLLGSWVYFSSMRIRKDGSWGDIWFEIPFFEQAATNRINIQKMLKVHIDLFTSKYSLWLEMYRSIGHLLSRIRTAASSNIRFIDVKFLLAAQAVETYHRTFYSGKYISEHDFRNVLNAVCNAAHPVIEEISNARLKERLSSSPRFANELSLKDRLVELLGESKMLSARKTLSVKQVDYLRNALSHGRKHKVDGNTIFMLYRLLLCAIDMDILRRLKFDPDEIDVTAYARYPELFRDRNA